MSTLDELRIAGIRNFGSETDEQQKIQFSAPLTLIVGANGCGKTTIIECIKYALTGEYPPNSNNGQNFLNDPKQSGLSETKGFAKLRVSVVYANNENLKRLYATESILQKKVKNVNRGTTTISRGAKVSVKGDKMQMKSEDTTLVMKVDDKEITLSKRKDEATEQMCEVMGVSKAIINYVLFCHQEESDWPLSTDQDVMSRFDKIFGTTEYNTALEKLRKKRKDLDAEVKEKKIGLKEFEMNKREVDRKKMELESNQEKLNRKNGEYEKYSKAIEPKQTELNKILAIEQNLGKLTAERAQVETEYKNKTENRQKLLNNIKNRLNNSIEELVTKMRLFKSEMSSKEQELTKTKSNLERENSSCDIINRKCQELDRELAGLIAQSEQMQEAYAEKAGYIRKMCERLGIPITIDLNNDNKRAEEVAKQAETAVADEEKKVDELQKKNDQVQTAHENRITELRNKKVTIQTALKGNREQFKQLNEDVTKLNSIIADIEKKSSELKRISDKIEETQKQFDNPKHTQEITVINDSILVNHTRIAELNDDIEQLDEQINVLGKNASVMAEVNAKEKQKEKYDNDVRRIQNKHADKLAELLNGERIERNFKQRVEQENHRLRSEIDRIEKELRANDNQLSECLHSHRSKKQEKTRLEAKLRELEDKIDECCQSMPFDDVLAETKENAAKAQMEYSKLQSAKEFFKDYIDKMQKKPCCPLCHKDLNGNEVDDLNDELNGQIESLPSKIQQTGQTLNELKAKLETLLGLQPSVESVNTMRNESIPLLQRELVDIEKKRSLAQTQKTKLEKSLEQPKKQIEIAQQMVGDMSLLDDSLREAERIGKELNQLKAKLPDTGGSGLSLDEAQVNRKALSDEKKHLEADTRKMENCSKVSEAKRNDLQRLLLNLKDQKMKLNEGIQSLDEKRTRIKEVQNKIADLEAKKREMEASLAPIENDLKRAIDTKEQEKAKNAKQLKDEHTKLNELKQMANSINRCRDKIKQYDTMKLDQNISEREKKLSDLKRQARDLKSSIDTIQQKIETLNKEIADQGALERNLQDNVDLLKLESEMEQMKGKLDDLRRNEGDIDFEEQTRIKNQLNRELNRIAGERNQISGQISEIQGQINGLQAGMNEPHLKNAVQNYRRAFYEKFVMEKMIVDLQTYCETLERALTKYHSEKMSKINRLIRELWRSIYKGNDIDFIEISTEETKHTSSKKRSYTYRVMQSKNDTKNIMRGNCSAGQRVLACLVIRIALAETFSANCGVLALDEPTTNLDRLNIVSLVEELRRFIEERENQQNFMLLVITHDEEFIQMLGRSGSYHRVSRNAAGKSVITKLRTR